MTAQIKLSSRTTTASSPRSGLEGKGGGQPTERCFFYGVPMVRIHLPPAASQERTSHVPVKVFRLADAEPRCSPPE
jgi:hypothetical protein